MALTAQNHLTRPNFYSQSSRNCSFYLLSQTHVKTSKFCSSVSSKLIFSPLHCSISRTLYLNPRRFSSTHLPLKAYDSDGALDSQDSVNYDFNLDAFLSTVEFMCLASSAAISVVCAVNVGILGSQRPVFGWLGSRILVWQCVILIAGVVIGAVIRRRQWSRICRIDFSRSGGSKEVNLLERIEKIEEELRSSTTIVRVLSRQLEKLGIRFRVTRKALKDPIAESAALAQKNSEATRALAVQGEVLEKELGEIQKVLLAMQEQQQKQLELILAIGKSGKVLGRQPGAHQDLNMVDESESTVDGVPHLVMGQSLAIDKEDRS